MPTIPQFSSFVAAEDGISLLFILLLFSTIYNRDLGCFSFVVA